MRAVIMKRTSALVLSLLSVFGPAFSQTPSTPQKPQEIAPEDIIRITTQLVQTDVVVTDKNDKIVKDLKLEDFELYDNGKKQELKFLEFVNCDPAVGCQITQRLRFGTVPRVLRKSSAGGQTP